MSKELTKVAEQLVAALGKANILAARYLEVAKTAGRESKADRLGGRLYPNRLTQELRAVVAALLPSVKLPGIGDAKRRGKYRGLSLAGLDDKPVIARLPIA